MKALLAVRDRLLSRKTWTQRNELAKSIFPHSTFKAFKALLCGLKEDHILGSQVLLLTSPLLLQKSIHIESSTTICTMV